jgi:predicted nucleotidyltransferase
MKQERDLANFKETLRKIFPQLKDQYSVSGLGIFGSYAREEQHKGSDLDVLVLFDEPPSLFRYIELENMLSDSLGVKVDLVMADALKPNLKTRILQEVQML